ncbi:NAD(P)-dependent dehydrogenase (short-subunit alcohol dehydrogenase family) [Chryseobacterium sp. 52]|uniref:SDR family NAD(P)-dependent oxidoreductase n=1 Tax=Chryseobacterium sp. 52 TaxID=2035213 RepID=UPI000C17B5E4|nr:SDR family oxidoreductase [Chryseobacterium sp. 52]PIF43553.1 NAD(P)-dependent dehydrogenase (short-subunit alcohol dehydrogenase family) [Chryseobacterium sp. 52]
MNLQLEGKKAFISGSTQGIGLAIAKKLLDEGCHVVINGRNPVRILEVINILKTNYPNSAITGITADFSNSEQVESMLGQIGPIDILINNVGIFELKNFQDITDADWLNIFNVNVMSSIRLTQKLLPHMLEQNWGRIIFISSESGVNIPADMIHYGMSKAAMNAVANGVSKLTKGKNVTVNTLLGGPTYSDGVAKAVEQIADINRLNVNDLKSSIIQQTNPDSLLQRFIEPDEIASMAVFLSSSLSQAVNGASIRVDGGTLKVI